MEKGSFERSHKMKRLEKPEWRLSKVAIASTIGTFLSILIVQRELNLTFAMWYSAVVSLVIAANMIYVFFKRKRSNRKEDANSNHV